MKKYIDCDGVIVDTETRILDEYYRLLKDNPKYSIKHYLENIDWEYWIYQAGILNNSIDLLKYYDSSDTCILTKVHSSNEARAKINYFRDKGVENDIIIVPAGIKKCNVVTAFNNILVDDGNNNLQDWKEANGIPFYFGNEESEFDRIETLEDVLDPKRLKLLLEKRN